LVKVRLVPIDHFPAVATVELPLGEAVVLVGLIPLFMALFTNCNEIIRIEARFWIERHRINMMYKSCNANAPLGLELALELIPFQDQLPHCFPFLRVIEIIWVWILRLKFRFRIAFY
jgi:hypothetical protein